MVAARAHRSWARLRTSPLRLATLLLAAAPMQAQSRSFSTDDRLLLTDFTRIIAVAASRDRVFAVTPDAVVAYDAAGRRWEGPYAPPRPGALRGVFAAIADPLDGGLWLVRPDGYLHFDPGIQLWDEGQLPGRINDVALDELEPVREPHHDRPVAICPGIREDRREPRAALGDCRVGDPPVRVDDREVRGESSEASLDEPLRGDQRAVPFSHTWAAFMTPRP